MTGQIKLKQAGVSEAVISAMCDRAAGKAVEVQVVVATQIPTTPASAQVAVVSHPLDSIPAASLSNEHQLERIGGVELRLRLEHEISSKHAHEGDPVEFTLIRETKVGNRVLPAGSKASGHVKLASHKGLAGTPGQLIVTADSIKAPDAADIRIVGFLNGDSGPVITGKDMAVRIFDPLARGGDATIKEGAELTVRTQD